MEEKQELKNKDPQNLALQKAIEGYNLFITGGAGTGKSYTIKAITQAFDIIMRKYVVLAPTGIAALNVGGATIHRMFRAPLEPIIDDVYREPDFLLTVDTIIIDEISMCRLDLFEFVAKNINLANKKRNIKGKRNVQVIVVGDFFQLPPVMTYKDKTILYDHFGRSLGRGFCFQSSYWWAFGFETIKLEKEYRQDDVSFTNLLRKVRHGDTEGLYQIESMSCDHELCDAVTLCGTNKDAKAKNEVELDKIDSPLVAYESEVYGEVRGSDKPTDDILEVKIGARIMMLVNDREDRFQNGSMGTITACDYNSITVLIDGSDKEIEVLPYEWSIVQYEKIQNRLQKTEVGRFIQLPIRLGYAITIHKSQGQTYEQVNINPYCWDVGQLYVALSRARKVENIYFTNKLYSSYLKTAEEVIRFYDMI